MTEQTSKGAKRSKPRLHSSRSTQGSDSSHSRRPSSDTEYKSAGAQGSLLSVTSADSEQGPEGTFLDQAQHYPSLVGGFPPESDGGQILSAIMETTHQAERLKGGLSHPHIQTTGYLSSSPSATKLKAKKSVSTGRKSQNTSAEIYPFEMDETIQKSAIMVKRLRSKSESRKSENEYGDEIDPSDERHGQTPPYKRQLQSHQSEKIGDFTRNQITIPPDTHVLCDTCDRGFHQQCYRPHIDNKYIEIAELEWVCYACSLPLSTTSSQGISAMAEDMTLSGEEVSQEVKESYLKSLSKANLVKLITRIESSSPSIKLYPSHLSSPSATPVDQERLMSSTIAETILPFDSQPDQDNLRSSPTHPPTQGLQADYFDPYVAHFAPAAGSSSGKAQPSNNTDNHVQATTMTSSSRPPIASDGTEFSTNSSTPYPPSQPATPNTASHTGRQTPISGLTGSYHSVKAQDLPPYEEMIFMAIADLKQDAGSAPKAILDWVQEHYPVPETFRASCGQAISKAAKKGRLLKEGALYKLKPGYNYPRRISRQSGTTRARSQSYNSALPPGIPVLDPSNRGNAIAGSFDQINSIIDANLYGMIPGSAFPVQNQGLGPQVFASMGSNVMPGVQQQSVAPFKFDAQSFGHPLALQSAGLTGNNSPSDPKSRNMAGLIGLGVTNPPSGNTSDSELGMDSDLLGPRSSSISSNSSGQQSLAGSLHGSGTFTPRALQTQRSQPSQLAFPYDRTWAMNA
ncbi:hypothetical protein BGZ97_006993, partial [Linnemannia gamsii]